MGKENKNWVYENQLFFRFKDIGAHVTDEATRATIISYAIMQSLLDKQTFRRDKKQQQFDELKQIYQGFQALEKSYQTSEHEGYDVAFDLQKEVDPKLDNIVQDMLQKQTKYQKKACMKHTKSEIMYNIVKENLLEHNNHIQILKTGGLKLYNNTIAGSQTNGNANILNQDYELIQQAFFPTQR